MTKTSFLTPGPSALYPGVEDYTRAAYNEQMPSWSHRSAKFQQLYGECLKNLRSLLQLPDNFNIAFTGSATEVWERTLQSLVIEKSAHLVNGAFSSKFYEFAVALGHHATAIERNWGQGFYEQDMTFDPDTELVAVTLNETSAGVQTKNATIAAIRKALPEAIISVDIVSAAPTLLPDWNVVDTAMLSVQKGFGLPAGLGIWIFNERCLEKNKAVKLAGKYTGAFHSLEELAEKSSTNQTPETPNMLGIYLLSKVAGAMAYRGLTTLQNEANYKTAVLYQSIANHSKLKPFVTEKNWQSPTVMVCSSPDTGYWHKIFDRYHIKVGAGYGQYKNDHLRIASFPAHSKEQIEMVADIITSN